MKKVLMAIIVSGCWVASFATDARVISMGRSDVFFMDEVSIFRNPANINIYPNMVYGSYGVFKPTEQDTATNNFAAMQRNNRDPINPFFGAIVSYSLNQTSETKNHYPMFSIAAVFNRHDEMLDYITKGTDNYVGDKNDSTVPPVGKVDIIAGYVLENGGMVGIGGYAAIQSATTGNDVDYETSLYKGTAGINWPVAKSVNLEVSLNGGILRSQGDSEAGKVSPKIVLAENDWFAKGDIRLFSALNILNGDFVPHLGIQRINLYRGEVAFTDVAAGAGVNINIDKGFFWAGLEGLYKGKSYQDSAKSGIGGKVSFGIERSIWWDWFVIRVGGQKILMYTDKEYNNIASGSWYENPPSNASDNDLVGLGFGINVENRFRVDFVAAEDNAYTFTNFISGPQHHLFTRVSATYSF